MKHWKRYLETFEKMLQSLQKPVEDLERSAQQGSLPKEQINHYTMMWRELDVSVFQGALIHLQQLNPDEDRARFDQILDELDAMMSRIYQVLLTAYGPSQEFETALRLAPRQAKSEDEQDHHAREREFMRSQRALEREIIARTGRFGKAIGKHGDIYRIYTIKNGKVQCSRPADKAAAALVLEYENAGRELNDAERTHYLELRRQLRLDYLSETELDSRGVEIAARLGDLAGSGLTDDDIEERKRLNKELSEIATDRWALVDHRTECDESERGPKGWRKAYEKRASQLLRT